MPRPTPQNAFFPEKAPLTERLAANPGVYALARPKGFGKTLLLSAVETLFLEERPAWGGAVLRLDFGRLAPDDACGGAEAFSAALGGLLEESVRSAGFRDYVDDPADPVRSFHAFLARRPMMSTVLLIDDVDAPVLRALEADSADTADGENAVRRGALGMTLAVLNYFFAGVKEHLTAFRFCLMTGILPFQDTGLLTGFNVVRDVSRDPAYGALLGLTADVLRREFATELEALARTLGLTVDETAGSLEAHCGGYAFEPTGRDRGLHPAAVMRVLRNPQAGFAEWRLITPEDVTHELGLLRRWVRAFVDGRRAEGLHDRDDYRTFIPRRALEMPIGLEELSPARMLLHQGLLTFRETDSDRGEVLLDVPNEGARRLLNELSAPE